MHSPFAYKIVKDVLVGHRGYSYYGYEIIDKSKSSRGDKKSAKILLRLAARLDVGSTFMPEDTPDVFLNALKAADTRMSILTDISLVDRYRLICSKGDHLTLDILMRALERPGRILAIKDVPSGWAKRLFESLDEGLILEGKRNILIFSRPGMQKVSYTVSI